jgi:hypothetical protein
MRRFLALGSALCVAAALPTVAAAKTQPHDICKNGGWQVVVDENLTPFANQGDCVSYVNHGGQLLPPPF